MSFRPACSVFLALIVTFWPHPAPRAEEPVAIELVLAIDTSASVDAEEFELQFRGLANAFRDPAVLAAISETYPIGLAVCVVQWAGPFSQEVSVPWRAIRSEADAHAFADEVSQAPRIFLIDVTAIGAAVNFSAEQIASNEFVSSRRVIDVSGDGPNNYGIQPQFARERAVAQGITINGLVILNNQEQVYDHYRDQVIGGTGAFIQSANRFRDYGTAIRQKLIREIQSPPVSELPADHRHAEAWGRR